MSVLSETLQAQRVRGENAAWALLAADLAPMITTILGAHLGGDAKRLDAAELFSLVDDDLDELREAGFELPRTAQAYCNAWREAGYLVRRASAESRSETYELSAAALSAIRYAAELAEPPRSATESRLSTITERLRALARDTDPNVETRIRALQEARDRLDAQIDRASRGDVDVLEPEKARERALDILQQAGQLPADFARVRSELEAVNRTLREHLIEDEEDHGRVLDEIFRGVDLIAESDAGRSFAGFYALILDSELSENVETAIADVLDRPFASDLPPEQRRALRRLVRAMQEQSGEVHDVMSSFARSLRRFVQSRDFREERALAREIREALAEALPVARLVNPWEKTAVRLDLTSVRTTSIGQLSPHLPSASRSEIVVEREEGASAPLVDIAALRELARATEIDLEELRVNVRDVVELAGEASIARVLENRPATQGVASVVGLLVLAEQQARRLEGSEIVRWTTAGGAERAGTVGHYLFTPQSLTTEGRV